MTNSLKSLFLFAFLISAIPLHGKAYKQEVKGVPVVREAAYWVSQWSEFELPENLASFQIMGFGSSDVINQITDLIAPDGTVYVHSDSNHKLSAYSQPLLKNVISPNRTTGVLKGMSSLIVPNNPQLPSPAAGKWKFRALLHFEPLVKEMSFVIVGKTKEELTKNKVDIRVWVSPDSYWTKTPGQVERVISEAKKNLAEAHLELRVVSIHFLDQKTPEPMKLPEDMTAIAWIKNKSDSINVFLMPSMEYQNAPVNGLACIGGPIDMTQAQPCFVSMYANHKADSIDLQHQGKILAHEIGHYLGLFHTKDDGYHLIGSVFDQLEDTPEVISGVNMMDPGLHDETPHFSELQKMMLRLSPALH